MQDNNRREVRILLGVTGSVAAIKTDLLIKQIKAKIPNCKIKIVLTRNAQYFTPKGLETLDVEGIFQDEDEWTWKKRGDPVLHVELSKWADWFLVAPLDALTLSKLANGHCDNLLSCCLMAWDWETKCDRIVLCPSMNTKMWNHPATKRNIAVVRSQNVRFIGPISKTLMCGDSGVGAQEEPEKVADKLHLWVSGNCQNYKKQLTQIITVTITAFAVFGLIKSIWRKS